jgi:DNA-directed RNA polymerase specialized sigma24 family protein
VLSGLSSTDRKLVMLHTAGFKHREIARLLQISGSTSRSQLFRARAKIHRQYFSSEQLPADIAA